MRYRDGRRSLCLSSQSGCPLTCTFCATGQMRFGRNLTRLGDPRPGASFPSPRPRRPRRVHGHGRADAEPRQRARGVPAGCPRWASATAARRSRPSAGSRGSNAWPPSRCRQARPVASRRRPGAALGADAGQRPLSAGGRARGLPRPTTSASAGKVFVEYVMLARRQRLARPGAAAGRCARPAGVQGQPDPLQPHRLQYEGSSPKAIAAFASVLERRGAERHRAPDARTRDRRRLRSAGGAAAGERGRASR